jgi:hypothetical protein
MNILSGKLKMDFFGKISPAHQSILAFHFFHISGRKNTR